MAKRRKTEEEQAKGGEPGRIFAMRVHNRWHEWLDSWRAGMTYHPDRSAIVREAVEQHVVANGGMRFSEWLAQQEASGVTAAEGYQGEGEAGGS